MPIIEALVLLDNCWDGEGAHSQIRRQMTKELLAEFKGGMTLNLGHLKGCCEEGGLDFAGDTFSFVRSGVCFSVYLEL